MKKIKCGSCTGTWTIEDIDLERQKMCPYCGVSIRGETEFSEYDSLDKAIYGAMSKMGKDILQNPKQLVGFLMDTAPGLKKEIRIFSRIMNMNYATDIRHAFEQETDAAEATINNKLHYLFVEEEGFSDSWADTICKGLYGAVLFSKGLGASRLVNVEIIDVKESEQLEMVKRKNLIKEVAGIYFYDIKSKLEGKKFENKRRERQNCFQIFMNNYHLLENGVKHSAFARRAGFYGKDSICPFFHQLNLVIKENDSSDCFLLDFYQISDLGTAFYKAFTREKM